MIGAIVLALVVIVGIPVGFLMSMAVVSAIFGTSLKSGVVADDPDNELIDCNY